MINKLSTKTRAIARATNSSKAKAKAKHRRSMAFMSSKQQGFTLIELLVVVSILAALAGLASVAMDGYQQEAEEKITRVEMQRIASAIRRFKVDTGYWPKKETALPTYSDKDKANFSFLFNKPDNVPEWDIEYAIGWHGPYIDLPARKNIVTYDPVSTACIDLSATAVTSLVSTNLLTYALVDKFKQLRKTNDSSDYCVLAPNDSLELVIAEYSASPYLYETDFYHSDHELCKTTTNDCVVLRSFGADGKNGYHDDAASEDKYDDIIFVLAAN